MKLRIYYEDTDSGGVVYHTRYIAFCERARSELFFQKGISFEEDGFVVRELNATFYSPAKLGDIIEIKTKIDSIKRSFVNLTQSIYKDDKVLFKLKIKLVYLKNWKVSTISSKYMDILNALS